MKKLSALILALICTFSMCSCTFDPLGSVKDLLSKNEEETASGIDDGAGSSGAAEIVSATDLQKLFENMIIGD